ncbi:MAG: hypothetical protein MI861_01065 [Pirellulales bacterium]|nr:hypothetical protein [Pirellulales bacterium]
MNDGKRRPDPSHPTTSHRRRWGMRLGAICVGLLPFVLLELSLRLAGTPVAEAVDLQPLVNLEQLQPLFVLDQDADRWTIPESRMNFFCPASFPNSKSPHTRRIFVLGGSTVQGRPYANETAFSTWLQFRLRAAQPNTTFEVINCGGVSYASYRVAKIMDEVLGYQPDAIVLYTGHNEFLEDRTYAQTRSIGAVRRWASRWGGKLRTVQWLRRRMSDQTWQPTAMTAEVDARLDHAGGLRNYRRDASWKQDVESHFAITLSEMVRAAEHAKVPLVVCVPSGELVNTPPFKIAARSDLDAALIDKFEAAWQQAIDPELSDEARLDACQRCLVIDPQHAGAHYIAGRLLYARGQAAGAAKHLYLARDHDVCPLRATSSIVAAVTMIESQESLGVIDTNTLWDQRNFRGEKLPDGIADPEFFIDHVHPTIAGHQRLANQVAQELEKLLGIGRDKRAGQSYRHRVRTHLGGLGEDYYARGKQRLEGLRRWASGRAGEVGLSP